MKRLTMKDVYAMNMSELALNQVFVRDDRAWYRKGPEDECSVCDLILNAVKSLELLPFPLYDDATDEEVDDVMQSWLQFGEKKPEGILAILYRALWDMAEVRERLKLYEDICFAEDGTELLTPWVLRIFRETRLNTGPLTEEQLREMDGDPVYLDLGDGGEWVLVRLMENEVYFSHKNTICAPARIAFECGGKVYLFKPKSSLNAE